MLVGVFSNKGGSGGIVDVRLGLAVKAGVSVSVVPMRFGCSTLSVSAMTGLLVVDISVGVSCRTVTGLLEDNWKHPVPRDRSSNSPMCLALFNIK